MPRTQKEDGSWEAGEKIRVAHLRACQEKKHPPHSKKYIFLID